jgi:hypothetical protein
MPESLDNRSLIWIIDAADQIVYVNAAWLALARENDAPELSPARVLDHSLGRFIPGRETAYWCKQLVGRVRAGNPLIKFPFRCDSPDCRRFMEMELSLLAGAAIRFLARILQQELREPLEFLGPSGDRSETLLKIGSWCRKIDVPDHDWVGIEAVIEPLDLLGNGPMPRMTHTICESCSEVIRGNGASGGRSGDKLQLTGTPPSAGGLG